jgi:hypothetical protein
MSIPDTHPEMNEDEIHQAIYENRQNPGVKAILQLVDNSTDNALQIVCDDTRTDKETHYAAGGTKLFRELKRIIRYFQSVEPKE